jgi:hypothetical protein
MRSFRGWSVALLSSVALSACGGARTPSADEPPPRSNDGLYEFSASTPNQLIRGTILVDVDRTSVQFETPCAPEATMRGRPSGTPSATSVMRYYCGGAWLTFDRRNPRVAKWYANVEVPRQRQVCERYETISGRQVCASWNTETYYVYSTRTGVIQVRRIS